MTGLGSVVGLYIMVFLLIPLDTFKILPIYYINFLFMPVFYVTLGFLIQRKLKKKGMDEKIVWHISLGIIGILILAIIIEVIIRVVLGITGT